MKFSGIKRCPWASSCNVSKDRSVFVWKGGCSTCKPNVKVFTESDFYRRQGKSLNKVSGNIDIRHIPPSWPNVCRHAQWGVGQEANRHLSEIVLRPPMQLQKHTVAVNRWSPVAFMKDKETIPHSTSSLLRSTTSDRVFVSGK